MSPARPVPYVKTVFASSIDDTCDAKAHVKAPHISTVDRGPDAVTRRLGLDTADFYVARRQLGWLGHVARMDYSRLPRARRMLSCWVAHPRPRGAPRMTYGRLLRRQGSLHLQPRPQQVARARRRPPRLAGDAVRKTSQGVRTRLNGRRNYFRIGQKPRHLVLISDPVYRTETLTPERGERREYSYSCRL